MFTNEQLTFLSSKRNFLLKNEVDESVCKQLYQFQANISTLIAKESFQLPTKVSKLPGKITKGNNHNGFPFQVSDFPSSLMKEDIFTFRSTIWYGNFFSFGMILSGQPKTDFAFNHKDLIDKGYQLTFNEDIWTTEVMPETTIKLNTSTYEDILELIEKSDSFKLFKIFELNHISSFQRLGIDCFKELFSAD